LFEVLSAGDYEIASVALRPRFKFLSRAWEKESTGIVKVLKKIVIVGYQLRKLLACLVL
jgi:hypothetical protein